MQKEKTEKELAEKFSQQLYLSANKLSAIRLDDEETAEVKDEFPGKNKKLII